MRSRCSFCSRTTAPIFAALLALATAGCTAVSAEGADRKPGSNSLLPSAEAAVFLTRVGDEVTISWMSKTGMVYSLITKDRSVRNATWMPVPAHTNIPGTGEQMAIVLRVPADAQRAFNVSAVPVPQVKNPRRFGR